VFSMFLSSRAVPATPGERLGASTEHLPETCSLRAILRRSASPPWLTRLRLSSLRATARGFAAGGLPTSRHAGPASAGHLATSRRGPRFPTAQRFIGVGSFHPTRNTPLHGAPKCALPGYVAGLTVRHSRRRSWPLRHVLQTEAVGLVRGDAPEAAIPPAPLRAAARMGGGQFASYYTALGSKFSSVFFTCDMYSSATAPSMMRWSKVRTR